MVDGCVLDTCMYKLKDVNIAACQPPKLNMLTVFEFYDSPGPTRKRYHFGICALENVTQHDWEVFIAVLLGLSRKRDHWISAEVLIYQYFN